MLLFLATAVAEVWGCAVFFNLFIVRKHQSIFVRFYRVVGQFRKGEESAPSFTHQTDDWWTEKWPHQHQFTINSYDSWRPGELKIRSFSFAVKCFFCPTENFTDKNSQSSLPFAHVPKARKIIIQGNKVMTSFLLSAIFSLPVVRNIEASYFPSGTSVKILGI